MMNELLELFSKYSDDLKLSINISYNKVTDWHILICRDTLDSHDELFQVQHCDLNTCIAKAYLFLTEWLLEFQGGY